jgi:hypothetical protein
VEIKDIDPLERMTDLKQDIARGLEIKGGTVGHSDGDRRSSGFAYFRQGWDQQK